MVPRAETGVMQFEDDWPGIFIRGDDALAFSQVCKALIAEYKAGDSMPAAISRLNSLERLLAKCNASKKPEAQMAKLISFD